MIYGCHSWLHARSCAIGREMPRCCRFTTFLSVKVESTSDFVQSVSQVVQILRRLDRLLILFLRAASQCCRCLLSLHLFMTVVVPRVWINCRQWLTYVQIEAVSVQQEAA